jgi:hypothetical protein
VLSGLYIPSNSNEFGLCVSSPPSGNELCGYDALKGDAKNFLSTLIAVAVHKNIAHPQIFDLPQLVESGNKNKTLESNELGVELKKEELDLEECFLLLNAFKELGMDSSAVHGTNPIQDPSIDQRKIIPQRAYRLDFEKAEAEIDTKGDNLIAKPDLADLLKALRTVFSEPEGKARINKVVCGPSTEKTRMIFEKIYGKDFEKLEVDISARGTNPSAKILLGDLFKALGEASSKPEERAHIHNLVRNPSMEKATLFSDKGYGSDLGKLDVGIDKGTNSSERIHLAELFKSSGMDSTEAEKSDQTSDREFGKKLINPDEKFPVVRKVVLDSKTQEGEFSRDIGRGKAVEGATPKLKCEPQNTKGMTVESGSLERDFFNSHSDKTGSDKGQDALLLSNNQPSAKFSSTVGQVEQIEPFQKQLQTEVLSQIVKKAVLNLKDGHTEIRIELKPEFLGQIRMHVTAENQQVMIRMLTEFPMVKEIIENNIYQLKADLQNQGLEVDKFEVFISRDSDQFIGGRENMEFQGTRSQSDDREDLEEMPAEEAEETNQLVEKYSGGALIGVFA